MQTTRPTEGPPLRRTTGSMGRDTGRHVATSLATLLFLALLAFAAPGRAQSEWQVDVLIPDTVSVRMPTQEIAFGITHDTYPPDAFPARYPATIPEGGVLPVQVFSSAEGGWSLMLEIPDLVDETGRSVIRADQVLYRVNEGLWSRGSPVPQVIHTGIGPTGTWIDLDIEFHLELLGTEPPGSFSVSTRLTALGDGQAP